MLTLNIRKYGFAVNEDSGKVFETRFNDVSQPFNPDLKYDAKATSEKLPPVEAVYRECQKRGYSEEKTIDTLLRVYHRFRCFRGGYLKNKELTIGFIGYRGSGKSVSACLLTMVDWMLCPGFRCWSNMPICFTVRYKDAERVFASEPLPKLEFLRGDEDFERGVVLFDEINMEVAESTRYMSATNLDFSKMVQQIRKRRISVVWTAQNWNSVDARLRWQTDFIAWCQDPFFSRKHSRIGWRSMWHVMDSTGMSAQFSMKDEFYKKYLIDKRIGRWELFTRPFWGAYDTRQLQGQGEYSKKALEKQEANNRAPYEAPNITEDVAAAFARRMRSEHVGDRIYTDAVWRRNNITSRDEQTRIGTAMRAENFKKKRDSDGRYYWYIPDGEAVSSVN